MADYRIGSAYLAVTAKPDEGFGDAINEEATKAGDLSGESFGGSFGAKLKAVAPAAFAALAVAAGKALYDIGTQFDDMYDTIAIGTGATGEALDGLNESARNVLASVPASMDDVAQTVADLNTRLGVSGDELEGLASQYLEASRMLGTDIDISKTTAAFNAFGLEGEAVSDALDDLFTVSQATGIGVNELAASVQGNAASMQMLGFSFQETAAMVGAFDKAGLNTQQVMSSMSRGLVNLAKEGEQPQQAYQRVIGELQSFIDKGDEAGALNLASELFGTRGASQFIGALKSGAMGIDDLTAALDGNNDAIMTTAEATMSAQEKFQVMGNQLTVAIEPIASAVFDLITGIATGLMPIIQRLAPVIQGIAAIASQIIQTVGTAIGWLLDVIGGFVDTVVGFFTGEGDILTTLSELPGKALELGGKFITGLIDGVAGAVSNLFTWFTELPGKILEHIGDPLTWLYDTGKKLIQGAIDGIAAKAQDLWNATAGAFAGCVSTAENTLDIQSPSKVFRSIGAFMIEGAAIGVEAEGPDFQRTVQATMEAAIVTPPPMGYAINGAAAGTTNSINIENMTVQADDVDGLIMSINRRLVELGAM